MLQVIVQYIYLYVIILFLLNNVEYTYFHTPLLSLHLLSPSTYSLPTSPLNMHRLNLHSPLQVPTSLQEALSPCNLQTWGLDLAGERTTHHGCINWKAVSLLTLRTTIDCVEWRRRYYYLYQCHYAFYWFNFHSLNSNCKSFHIRNTCLRG